MGKRTQVEYGDAVVVQEFLSLTMVSRPNTPLLKTCPTLFHTLGCVTAALIGDNQGTMDHNQA